MVPSAKIISDKPTSRYLSDEVAGSDLALMLPGNLIRDPGSETAWVALPVSDISSFWETLSGIEETEHLRPFASPGSGQGEVNRFKHDETGLERGRDITPSSAVTALSEIVQTLEKYKEPLKAAMLQPRKRLLPFFPT